MYEAEKGDNFTSAAKKLQDKLKWAYYKDDKQQMSDIIEFNGIHVEVHISSRINDLSTIYHLKHELRRHEQ